MFLPLTILLACSGTDKDRINDTGCMPSAWFLDQDGDGYGAGEEVAGCDAATGHVSLGDDCDDSDVAVNPGANELCDGIDNDCDGATDPDDAQDAWTCYRDADGDGWGTSSTFYSSCTCNDGYVLDGTDCDDTDATTYPGATESWYDGVDSDCAGGDDNDADGDGFAWEGRGGSDCDDADPSISPDALDVCGDGIDNDCNGAGATCGLSGTVTEDHADITVVNGYVANFGYAPVFAGDSDGDGINEFMMARNYEGDDEKLPQHDFVLLELPRGATGVESFEVDDLVIASFQVPNPDRAWDAEVWSVDEAPMISDVDFDQDGSVDYMMASFQTDEDGPPTRLDIWYGPASGVVDLTDAQTVEASNPRAPPGWSLVLLDGPDEGGWSVAATTQMPTAYYDEEPSVYVLGPEHFDGTREMAESPQIFSVDGYHSGRGPDTADVDGDGIRDLLIGSTDKVANGHASGDLFLGPLEGTLDVLDADLVIDQTAYIVTPWRSHAVAYSQVILAEPQQEGAGVARIAVALPGQACDEGVDCGKVFVFDWTGPGWLEPEDADLVLVGPPASIAGNTTMRWGGDVDDDGVPELIVLAADSDWPTTQDGHGGLFLVEPPLSGTFALEDSDVVVRHDNRDTYWLGTAALGRHSLDGDEWHDLLVTDHGLGVDATGSSATYRGGFHVFRGGPSGF